MLKRVVITNYRGETMEYAIEGVQPDNASGVLITEISGLGPTKASINMTELTTMDGGLYNSARLSGRNIVIKARFTHATSIEEARLLSYKFFPIKKPLTFRIETTNRIAETVGYVESNEPDIFSEESTCQISILCESAFFNAAGNEKETRVSFSSIYPSFKFPYKNEPYDEKATQFGIIESLRENVVVYKGDSETGIEMKINAIGDASGITIYNVDTGESMRLDTTKMASTVPNSGTAENPNNTKLIYGDEVNINTIQGKKTINLIRNGIKYNILNVLDKNPSWFKLSKGNNTFVFSADSGEENIQFTIVAQIIYEGV